MGFSGLCLSLSFHLGVFYFSQRGMNVSFFCGTQASHCCGLSRCRAQALDAQAQRLTGPAAPRHVGSSRTRARTRVPCISRRTLNHCTTREAQHCSFCLGCSLASQLPQILTLGEASCHVVRTLRLPLERWRGSLGKGQEFDGQKPARN